MNILRFDKPSIEWVNFVVKNRVERNLNHGYDLIIGAAANDDTWQVVSLFDLLQKLVGHNFLEMRKDKNIKLQMEQFQ